jgi:hypothetical protein
MVTKRLTAVWRALTAKSVHLISQQSYGSQPDICGFGSGDIKDLMLMSRSLKQTYDQFIDMMNRGAAETGDLHTLQQIRDALDTLEQDNGGH